MERPRKRPRLSLGPENEGEVVDFDLQEARAQNDQRLKSIFEGIFEKYGRDFTEVGDEIDLQTGNIIVNNGHIDGLNGEGDIGELRNWLSDAGSSPPPSPQLSGVVMDNHTQCSEAEARDDSLEEDTGFSHHQLSILSQMRSTPGKLRESPKSEASNPVSESEDDRSSVDSLLDTALCVQTIPGSLSKGNIIVNQSKPVTKKANIAYEGSIQSLRVDRLSDTVDPVWRVPEISGKLSTLTVTRPKPQPQPSFNTIRSQSPPGAGSLWALPWKSRGDTDVTKRKSRKKVAAHTPKKHQSSPIICDWSFAQTPDGNESDDPLQEDYEPSPTPKGRLYIREKHRGPYAKTRATNKCACCNQSFSQDEYISHLRAALSSTASDQHDPAIVKDQLNIITSNQTIRSSPRSDHSRPTNTSIPELGSKKLPQTNLDSTPTRRARTVIGPEEARLIIKMKQVQGMKWKEILDRFPHKKLMQLTQWYHTHWKDRLANPPRLSRPWSQMDLEKLDGLKDQAGLTWSGIRAELPGRSHAEVEFELLRLWAGNVSHNQINGPSDSQGGQEATEAKYSPGLQPVSDADQPKHEGSGISPTAHHHGPIIVNVAVCENGGSSVSYNSGG